jgi:hypothetical protein
LVRPSSPTRTIWRFRQCPTNNYNHFDDYNHKHKYDDHFDDYNHFDNDNDDDNCSKDHHYDYNTAGDRD